ncbi:MAG TPA: hypothetical protein VHN16_09990 [Streptosporangiaceae bacterium]|nr:hypothetical protein [Streptosporangiaceae bacterium]
MADRQEWEHATADSRRLAIAADAELRRRHPGQKIEPLRSSEATPVTDTEREQLNPAPDGELIETTDWINDLPIQRQAFHAALKEHQRPMVADADLGAFGDAFRRWSPIARDAILQPPMPQITPSVRILGLAAGRDTEPEAAD